MKRTEFTIAAGLEVQAENLADWKSLLNDHTYAALESAVKQENERRQYEGLWNTGHDVPRGIALDVWIKNINNDWNPLPSY